MLLKTRSRKVSMACHWFRHHARVSCIPVLTCQLHQGLIIQKRHQPSADAQALFGRRPQRCPVSTT